MRVLGIDPGTVSIDVCGLEDGVVCLDRSIPTEEALAEPRAFVELLRSAGVPDLVAGPSGYGLPLIDSQAATDAHRDADRRIKTTAPQPGVAVSDSNAVSLAGMSAMITRSALERENCVLGMKSNGSSMIRRARISLITRYMLVFVRR